MLTTADTHSPYPKPGTAVHTSDILIHTTLARVKKLKKKSNEI